MTINTITEESLLKVIKNQTKLKTKITGQDAWVYTEKDLKQVINEILTIIKNNI